tara:strand:- start:412 stop:942 length:531 start_codon:yes stop_codon:yes gene_type:complete
MKINGYQIRESIKRWLVQRDTFANQFRENLYAFEGEDKPSPRKVMESFDRADRSVARLEEIQQLYNQVVKCGVQDEQVTLALCVKLVGGAGRRAKMWRDAGPGKKDRYSYRDEGRERNKDTTYAARQVSVDDAVLYSTEASKYASALRNAIAKGNCEQIDCGELGVSEAEYGALFE